MEPRTLRALARARATHVMMLLGLSRSNVIQRLRAAAGDGPALPLGGGPCWRMVASPVQCSSYGASVTRLSITGVRSQESGVRSQGLEGVNHWLVGGEGSSLTPDP